MARAGAKYEVVDFPVWGFRWHKGSLTAGGRHEEDAAVEFRRLCETFGYGNQAFWRMMMRLTQLVDGSFARRRQETRRAASFVPAGKPSILHLVPGLEAPNNGIAVAAKLIAREQAQSGDEVEVMETRQFLQSEQSNNRTILRGLGSLPVATADDVGMLEGAAGREAAGADDARESRSAAAGVS